MPAWEEIALTSTPLRRGRPDLAQVGLHDEAVLYVEERDDTQHLNQAAAAVWRCLDGRTSLRELASDVAAVTGWDRAAVEADTLALVRGFGRDGLLSDVVPAPARRRPAESLPGHVPGQAPQLVRVPPSECAQRSNLPWAPTRAVHVGRYAIGVRSAPGALDRLVHAMLAPHLLTDTAVPPNCSVRLASGDGARFHRLFRGCETSVRTRSLRRLLRAVGGFLGEYAVVDDAAAVHFDALVLVHRGEALLLPPELRPLLPAEEAMRRRDITVVDAATAALEPDSGRLLVRQPAFAIDDAIWTQAAGLETEPQGALQPVGPGRYPVRCWAFLALGDDRPAGPAHVVAAANRRVRNRSAVGAQAALSTLAQVASTAHLVHVPAGEHTSVTLDRLVGAISR